MDKIQSVRLSRECEVVQIPSGQRMMMGADTPVDITQSLGGAYVVNISKWEVGVYFFKSKNSVVKLIKK